MNPQPKPQPRPKRPRKPLRRSKRLNAISRTRKRNGRDPAYLAFVHTLHCFCNGLGRCDGPIHAHHAIHKSQGGTDRDAIPLCRQHHVEWHAASGAFGAMSKAGRRIWSEVAIMLTREAWEARK